MYNCDGMTTVGTPFQGGMIGRCQRDHNTDRGTTWPDCESEDDYRIKCGLKAQCPSLEIKTTMRRFIVPERSEMYLYMIRVLYVSADINEEGEGGLTTFFFLIKKLENFQEDCRV